MNDLDLVLELLQQELDKIDLEYQHINISDHIYGYISGRRDECIIIRALVKTMQEHIKQVKIGTIAEFIKKE